MSDFPYPHDEHADAAHHDDEATPAEAKKSTASVAPGTPVTYSYVDAYSGSGDEEVAQHGIVLAVNDGVAVVALFPQVSELPVDELETT